MDFIRELLDESKGKKKKVSRVARHAVYHADYVKTKNKPYRKYHKDGSPVSEGDEFDFSGDRENMDVDQPEEDLPQDDMSQDQDFGADEFGGEEGGGDIAAELERIIADLSELLDQYDAEQGGEEQPEGGEEQLPDDIEGQDQEYPEETPGDQEEQRFTPQFSSWLQKMSGVELKEYHSSTMFPKTAVAAPAIKAAAPCCLYKKQAAAKVKEIAGKFSKEADVNTSLAAIKKVAIKHHQNGGKHGERIYNILSKHMSK